MYRGATVGVVVPAYNEEGFVGEVIRTVPEFVDRVYVVDDCSTDSTWEEICEHAEAVNDQPMAAVADGGTASFDPRVVTFRHEENKGVGGAIKTGYRHARADNMDVTAVMNGDGQMDPDILDRIIDPVVEGEADYAKGDRLTYRAYREDMSGFRLFGNVLLTFLTKIASGYWKMTDPQNGYTAISLEALEGVDIEAAHDEYGFCNDLLIRLNIHDYTIADVPMPAIYGEETSHIRYSTFIPSLSLLLLAGFLRRLRTKYLVMDFHPLVFLYVFGALGGVLAMGYGVWTLVGIATGGVTMLHVGLALVTGLVSVLMLTLAMVFDMRANRRLERHA